MSAINISETELLVVKNILIRHIPEYDVYVFGSRVCGNARKSSDLDLAIMSDVPLETMRMIDLKSAFSESDLPFKADLVDWASINENFHKIIESCRTQIQIKNIDKTTTP
jgi:hypothetical protein